MGARSSSRRSRRRCSERGEGGTARRLRDGSTYRARPKATSRPRPGDRPRTSTPAKPTKAVPGDRLGCNATEPRGSERRKSPARTSCCAWLRGRARTRGPTRGAHRRACSARSTVRGECDEEGDRNIKRGEVTVIEKPGKNRAASAEKSAGRAPSVTAPHAYTSQRSSPARTDGRKTGRRASPRRTTQLRRAVGR